MNIRMSAMGRCELALLLLLGFVVLVFSNPPPLFPPSPSPVSSDGKIKVYFDQDVMIGSSNILSLAMLLRHSIHPSINKKIEVVGVGVVAGDSHIQDAIYHALHAVEFCDTPHIPVSKGADVPFVNSKAHVLGRMIYGPKGGDNWFGEWSKGTEIKKLPGIDDPSISLFDHHAALLLIDLARKHEGELVVVTAGPVTNIALAVRLAPDIVGKIKAVYTMAGAIHVKSKFNFWWDAESSAVFLRQNWTKKVIVPIDVCDQTKFTRDLMSQATPSTPSPYKKWLETQFAQSFAEFHFPMWDELLIAVLFDDIYGQNPALFSEGDIFGHPVPKALTMKEKEEREKLLEKEGGDVVVGCGGEEGGLVVREEGAVVERGDREGIVTERELLFMDVDYNPGPNYGGTLWWENNEKMKKDLPEWLKNLPPWEVITKINTQKFEEMFVSVMASDH